MPTEIRIVLPVPLEEDAVSVTDNEESTSRDISEEQDQNGGLTENKSCTTDVNQNIVTENQQENTEIAESVRTSPTIRKRHGHDRKHRNSSASGQHHHRDKKKHQQESQQPQQRWYSKKEPTGSLRQSQEKKLPLQQTVHNLGQAHLHDGHNVVLDKGSSGRSTRNRPASAAPRIQSTSNNVCPTSKQASDVGLSVADSYDVDTEHHDIMLKALKSYVQHRSADKDSVRSDNQTLQANADLLEQTLTARFGKSATTLTKTASVEGVNLSGKDEHVKFRSSDQIYTSSDEPKLFKLSQCRLRFHDDGEACPVETRKKQSKSKQLSPVVSNPTLYALEEGSGVLVDSVGHVYSTKRVRPWSALPGKFSDFLRTNRSEDTAVNFCSDRNHRSRTSSASSIGQGCSATNQLKVVTLKLGGKMSQPITRSSAYQRRNQTTHLWTDSSQLMSRSLPATNSFMHRHLGSSASSPRSSRDATSEKSSPAGKPTAARPSSSYSYDGGFFVGAHSGQAEYFVIHPDWVSEALTIKKLSVGNKANGPPVQRSSSLRLHPFLGRRCLSAPPKNRNPITWDQSEPVDIPTK